MIKTYFKNEARTFGLSQGDCIEIMSKIAQTRFLFDMIFADPPYFLSNGGISVQNGKQACVDGTRFGVYSNMAERCAKRVKARWYNLD